MFGSDFSFFSLSTRFRDASEGLLQQAERIASLVGQIVPL